MLKANTAPISATCLANEFSVTRQIIVADIALLRAMGNSIRSEHRGYVLEKSISKNIKRIVVKHDSDLTREELYTIVDNGGRVVDVVVEHTVYGQLSATLNLASRYDVDKFLSKVASEGATPLSQLTEGLHIHSIDVNDEEAYERIIAKLTELKILVENE